jgi:hypothetical protein
MKDTDKMTDGMMMSFKFYRTLSPLKWVSGNELELREKLGSSLEVSIASSKLEGFFTRVFLRRQENIFSSYSNIFELGKIECFCISPP